MGALAVSAIAICPFRSDKKAEAFSSVFPALSPQLDLPESLPPDIFESPGLSLGVVRYRGGFIEREPIVLGPTVGALKGFKVDLADFCRAVVIKEAGVVVDHNDIVAKQSPRDKTVYIIDPKDSPNVQAVWITLNGPLDSQCDIPIYSAEPLITDPGTPSSTSGFFIDVAEQVKLRIEAGKIVYNNLRAGNTANSLTVSEPLEKTTQDGYSYSNRGQLTYPVTGASVTKCIYKDAKLELTYAPDYSLMTLKFTAPDHVTQVDSFGSCVYSPPIARTYNMKRAVRYVNSVSKLEAAFIGDNLVSTNIVNVSRNGFQGSSLRANGTLTPIGSSTNDFTVGGVLELPVETSSNTAIICPAPATINISYQLDRSSLIFKLLYPTDAILINGVCNYNQTLQIQSWAMAKD